MQLESTYCSRGFSLREDSLGWKDVRSMRMSQKPQPQSESPLVSEMTLLDASFHLTDFPSLPSFFSAVIDQHILYHIYSYQILVGKKIMGRECLIKVPRPDQRYSDSRGLRWDSRIYNLNRDLRWLPYRWSKPHTCETLLYHICYTQVNNRLISKRLN